MFQPTESHHYDLTRDSRKGNKTMSITQQDFLANSTEQAAKNLFAALLALPEEKRGWRPADTARTALELVAECAQNNAYTADLIENRTWNAPIHDEYLTIQKGIAAKPLSELEALLQENTRRIVAVIRATPDDAMPVTLDTPFGAMTVADSAAYPYWNMSYHEGQINYIASL
jgi:hypothetical protein